MNEAQRSKLISSATNGDHTALQRLIIDYHAPLRASVDREISPEARRRFDAEDILQEAYAAAFENIKDRHFDTPASFYKWLEAIALNDLKDQERAARRQKRNVDRENHGTRQPRTSYGSLFDGVPTPDRTPSRQVRTDEAIAAVLSSLARLTHEQRKVIRLRYLESRPVVEIAEQMGKTEMAIHSLCRRGLKALHEAMGSITQYLSRL